MIYNSNTEQAEGEGAEFSAEFLRGNGRPKELEVRQQMSGLSCQEGCNYPLMVGCAQFGFQKPLSAHRAGMQEVPAHPSCRSLKLCYTQGLLELISHISVVMK